MAIFSVKANGHGVAAHRRDDATALIQERNPKLLL
jgi:hypothetical protein